MGATTSGRPPPCSHTNASHVLFASEGVAKLGRCTSRLTCTRLEGAHAVAKRARTQRIAWKGVVHRRTAIFSGFGVSFFDQIVLYTDRNTCQ